MHDIKWIRENAHAFDAALKRRGLPSQADHLISIDERRRAIIRVLEAALMRRKAASKENEIARRAKDEATVKKLAEEVIEIKKSISTMEREERDAAKELHEALAAIPNLPLPEVPDGIDEHSNVVRHHFGAVRNYAFVPKPHDDLGGALGFMDFETAAKLSGARFVVLKKGLARLERAIGQFMLDLHTNEHGYTEINPPLLVRDDVMFGTGQLPKFADDQYSTANTAISELEVLIANRAAAEARAEAMQGKLDYQELQLANRIRSKLAVQNEQIAKIREVLESSQSLMRSLHPQIEALTKKVSAIGPALWLIPTAEVPLTNLVRKSVLDEEELPMRLTALTPCFRAEAGAAGRDTRGMIRQHQFTKVELVSITTPDQSKDEHERMLACAEEVLRRLDLHYRVMTLCAGDMGFAAQKTYDIEVWMPGQGDGGAYREISSCSVCGDFQARRMDARFRPSYKSVPLVGGARDVAIRPVHTLNGSGTAVGRALIAVMETYQQEDGSIAVPDVLQPYMGGLKVIERDK